VAGFASEGCRRVGQGLISPQVVISNIAPVAARLDQPSFELLFSLGTPQLGGKSILDLPAELMLLIEHELSDNELYNLCRANLAPVAARLDQPSFELLFSLGTPSVSIFQDSRQCH
jgi:hypothetical protein